jgi:hypothetical protein
MISPMPAQELCKYQIQMEPLETIRLTGMLFFLTKIIG